MNKLFILALFFSNLLLACQKDVAPKHEYHLKEKFGDIHYKSINNKQILEFTPKSSKNHICILITDMKTNEQSLECFVIKNK